MSVPASFLRRVWRSLTRWEKRVRQRSARAALSLRTFWQEALIPLRARHFWKEFATGGWPLWLTLLGLATALVVGFFLSNSREAFIRYTGFSLELLGISTVAAGLSSTRRLFGRPSVVEKSKAWLKRLIDSLKKPKPIVVSAEPARVQYRASSATVARGLKENPTLEDRLSHLEEQIRNLSGEARKFREEVRASIDDVNKSVSNEIRDRRNQQRELRAQLESLSVGGLNLETVGLVWILIGVTFSSLPEEIANLLF